MDYSEKKHHCYVTSYSLYAWIDYCALLHDSNWLFSKLECRLCVSCVKTQTVLCLCLLVSKTMNLKREFTCKFMLRNKTLEFCRNKNLIYSYRLERVSFTEPVWTTLNTCWTVINNTRWNSPKRNALLCIFNWYVVVNELHMWYYVDWMSHVLKHW